jgi:hypothetical protein
MARQRAGRGRGTNSSAAAAVVVQQDYRMDDLEEYTKLRESCQTIKTGTWKT